MLTYYGNLFSRANTDPYHNSHPSGTQFRVNGYSDVDRRWSDRGNLYIADGNDNHPGVVRLKSTPILGVAAPGPNSLRTGTEDYSVKPCCGDREEPSEDEEDKRDCVADAKNFLDSLLTPNDYGKLLDSSARTRCSPALTRLCNMYSVTVWHCTVKCVWINGWCYNCLPGDTGKLCLCAGSRWCEEYIFPSCRAARAFLKRIEPMLGLYHPVAVVGEDTMIARSWFTRCDDDLCENLGCLLFPGRNSPVAYTSGVPGDRDCGKYDIRQPASENSAWVKTVC